jgi:hypothetical protein
MRVPILHYKTPNLKKNLKYLGMISNNEHELAYLSFGLKLLFKAIILQSFSWECPFKVQLIQIMRRNNIIYEIKKNKVPRNIHHME